MKKTDAWFILLLAILLNSASAYSQDWSWWNEKHNWDGVTHWTHYLIVSPSYLGPNALPVPAIKQGIILQNFTMDIGGEGHFSTGDKTTNLYTDIFIPVCKSRAGINLTWIPVEYYQMDTLTRDERRARDYDGKGFATGDLIIGTYIRILKERDRLPGILLTINLKAATGSNMEGARYADSPGYHFDLSFGKSFPVKKQHLTYFRLYGMMGLYVYQTHYDKNYQNDAFLYGGGINLGWKKFIIENQLGGYIGYIGDGDRPVVYRLKIRSNRDARLNYALLFQQGIHDFDYSTIRVSAIINLKERFADKK